MPISQSKSSRCWPRGRQRFLRDDFYAAALIMGIFVKLVVEISTDDFALPQGNIFLSFE
jgi:hypothetical protein